MSGKVRTITQRVLIAARPEQVYDALTSPTRHAAFTGARTTGARRVGARFTAYDGYITGVHRQLTPGKRIVQDWWTSEWPEGAPPSRLQITLRRAKHGTELKMVHEAVPAEQADSYRQGWIEYYWTPLQDYFDSVSARLRAKAIAGVTAKASRPRSIVGHKQRPGSRPESTEE